MYYLFFYLFVCKAPSHDFLLPEDVWIELVPRKQSDAWRVVEAEQNPRLRLRVDINRQLFDVIVLTERKWKLAAERIVGSIMIYVILIYWFYFV